MTDWFFIVMIYVGQSLVYTYSSDIDYASKADCVVAADRHGEFRQFASTDPDAVVTWDCYQKGDMVP